MMPTVKDFVSIRKGEVIKNGKSVFKDSSTGSLGKFLKNAYKDLGITYPKFYKMDTLSKLGFIASEYLLQNRPFQTFEPEEIGVILSNVYSTFETDKKHQQAIESEEGLASPAVFVYTLPNIMTGEICIRNGFKGENAFFITENFDAELLVTVINNLFLTRKIKAAVAGMVDETYRGGLAFLYSVVRTDDEEQLPGHTWQNIKNLFEKNEYGGVNSKT